jgi:deazaflavin-dependent oxidoreductase (nitroreductase family)
MQMPGMLKQVIRGFSRFHSTMFRTFGGAGVIGKNTLLLTTRGRKTGRETTTPLLYVEQSGRLYIVASFGGNDQAPGWYRNLTAHPEVGVEMPGGGNGRYRARSLSAEEALPIWPKLLAMYPAYAGYQKRTTRVIPVVELTPP